MPGAAPYGGPPGGSRDKGPQHEDPQVDPRVVTLSGVQDADIEAEPEDLEGVQGERHGTGNSHRDDHPPGQGPGEGNAGAEGPDDQQRAQQGLGEGAGVGHQVESAHLLGGKHRCRRRERGHADDEGCEAVPLAARQPPAGQQDPERRVDDHAAQPVGATGPQEELHVGPNHVS